MPCDCRPLNIEIVEYTDVAQQGWLRPSVLRCAKCGERWVPESKLGTVEAFDRAMLRLRESQTEANDLQSRLDIADKANGLLHSRLGAAFQAYMALTDVHLDLDDPSRLRINQQLIDALQGRIVEKQRRNCLRVNCTDPARDGSNYCAAHAPEDWPRKARPE